MGSTAVDTNVNCKIRTIPPWVASWEDKHGPTQDLPRLVPRRPPHTIPSAHNGTPAAPQRRVSRDGYIDWTVDKAKKRPVPKTFFAKRMHMRQERLGRRYDHLRSAGAVIMPFETPERASEWRDFVKSNQWAPVAGERSEKIDPEQLEDLMPGFNDTSTIRLTGNALKKRSRRGALYEHIWRLLLNHPLVPALLRFSVLLLSLASLGLAANLWELYGASPGTAGTLKSQWLVAIVVDCVVSPYVVYMTYDEFTAPQLGLRSPMHKAALTLLDLVFIIFKAASTTLAFDSLSLQGNPPEELAKMKALASFLLLGLMGWIMNFTVNVFRLVQRLGPQDRDNNPRFRISHV